MVIEREISLGANCVVLNILSDNIGKRTSVLAYELCRRLVGFGALIWIDKVVNLLSYSQIDFHLVFVVQTTIDLGP